MPSTPEPADLTLSEIADTLGKLAYALTLIEARLRLLAEAPAPPSRPRPRRRPSAHMSLVGEPSA